MSYQIRTGGQYLPQMFEKYSQASRFANDLMRNNLARRAVVVQSTTRKELAPLIK